MKNKLLFRVMRLLVLFWLVGLMHVSAGIYSQTVTLKGKSLELAEVFSAVRKQTGLGVYGFQSMFEGSHPVTVDVKAMPVDQFLKLVLNNQPLEAWIENHTIVIKRKREQSDLNSGSHAVESVQQRTVTGRVTDQAGNPLEGVTVRVKGTNVVTITNADGSYQIDVQKSGSTLSYTTVGFESVTLVVENQSAIHVALTETVNDLDEVVVVGYGTQKKLNLTGAVQSVDMSDAINTPVSNSGQLMYGKFSGVNLTQNSGLPGQDGSSIVIRGIGTFGNRVPLVVIDGMQFDGLREFNQLSPADIKSVTVLKDASAVAIYGARGANGVILIETKKGLAGKFQLSYNNYFGIQDATRKPEFASAYEYAILMNENLIGRSGGNNNAARYTEKDLQEILDGTNPDQFANTDWVDVLLQKAPVQNHHFSAAGGNQHTTYRVGIGYLSQGSIIDGKFGYDRLSYMLNLNSAPKEWLRINNSLLGAYKALQGPSNYNTRASLVMQKLALSPTIPVKYSNGYYGVSDGTFKRSIALSNQHNPVEEGYFGNYEDKSFNINNRFSVSAIPLKSLSIESAISVNLDFNDISNFTPMRTTYWWDGSTVSKNAANTLENSFNKESQWLWENIVRYDGSIGAKHEFNFLVGHSASVYDSDGFNGSLQGFPTDNLYEFNAGGTLNPKVSGNRVGRSLQSFFGRVNYNFANRYLFEANFRRDGSSKFGPDNRYANFPSISAGWVLSEEGFFQNSKFLDGVDLLKIRGSWGKTGNNRIGDYIWNQTYDTGIDYILGRGQQIASGVAMTSLANRDIKWETSEQFNIGLDAYLLKNRLGLVVDYFRRNSYDVLYTNFPVPSTLGVSSLAARNSASVLNTGLEANLNYQKRGNFSYQVGLNVTKMFKQTVTDLGGGIQTIAGNTIIAKGQPFMAYYGYQWAGIFQTSEEVANAPIQFGYSNLKPGDVRYADIDGPDGAPDGKVDAYDRKVIGNPHPAWYLGANVSLQYKGFDCSFAFQGLLDVDRFIQDDPTYGFETVTWNAYRYWMDRWTPENPSNTLHRIGGNKENNIRPSAQYLEDGSYVRLRNIELGYTLPVALRSRLGLAGMRVFAAAQNVLTFTSMNGNLDPERNMSNFSVQNVPIYKVYSVGVNITL
ncbi:TonB-dependent receptor [Parapedobacter sp. 2B3]|uniref:TonB-dependent receptor n=1 Tax=Parapedobacter sp. 2B3 TaxID=3342381 RepID=UPI0035B6905B